MPKAKLQIVCAWCGKCMGAKDGKGVEGTSHSICDECKEKELEQAQKVRMGKEIRVDGKIAQLVKARKGYKCTECGLPIEAGTQYYRVYLGGSGLWNLKHPDHVHIYCFHKEHGK